MKECQRSPQQALELFWSVSKTLAAEFETEKRKAHISTSKMLRSLTMHARGNLIRSSQKCVDFFQFQCLCVEHAHSALVPAANIVST